MQIIITGIERSGATLAAAIVQAMGIEISLTGFRPPRSGWTYPTLEDQDLARVLGSAYEDENALREAFANYVGRRDGPEGKTWAVKSTLLDGTLPLLTNICSDPLVIDVWRAPSAVISSWQTATDVARQSAEDWYLKNRARHENALRHSGCRVLRVDFDDLVADPMMLVQALDSVGVPCARPDLVYGALNEDLIHVRTNGTWIKRAVHRKLGPWGKLAVGVRTLDGPKAEFFMCYQRLLGNLRPGDGVLQPATHLPAHWAADSLARAALNTDADSFFFLDDDMTFGPRDLEVLRESVEGQQYDVLSAFATRRQNPARPITMRRLQFQPPEPMSIQGVHYAHVLEYPPDTRVFDADMTGLAFTLIRRHVFEAMVGEWGPAWTTFFPFVAQQSDDAQFCVNAKALGFKIGVCLDVPIGHIGNENFGVSQLNQWLTEVNSDLERELNAPATA